VTKNVKNADNDNKSWKSRRVEFVKYACLEATDASTTGINQFTVRRWVRESDALAFMRKIEKEQFLSEIPKDQNLDGVKSNGIGEEEVKRAINSSRDFSDDTRKTDGNNYQSQEGNDSPFYGGGPTMM